MRNAAPPGPSVVVVGGGISGLAAAWRLTRAGARVTVLEQADRFGGKLWSAPLGEVEVDLGAEAFLARRPEAVGLVAELGLTARLVHPVTTAANVFSRGGLHPLPPATLMGAPTRPDGLAGILDDDETARALAEPQVPAPPLEQDVDVRSYVAARFGPAVVDRLVEPLLGGVYAGHAGRLSLAASAGPLWQHALRGGPLLRTDIAEPPAGPGPGAPASAAPMFGGLDGGVGTLPVELAAALRRAGAELRTGVTVRGLERLPDGWRVLCGSAGEAGPPATAVTADAVLLAVPAPAATKLLAGPCAAAAAELAPVRVASVGVVAVLLPRAALAGLPGSGVLVPPVEGRPVKAVTFSSAKWAWTDRLHPDLVVARMSLGRDGEVEVLQRDDADLVRLALDDVAGLLGRPLRPVATRVVRWGGSLPQPDVGHLDRVRRVRDAVAGVPGLAVCGAMMDGVGIPACIAAADRAARELLTVKETMAV